MTETAYTVTNMPSLGRKGYDGTDQTNTTDFRHMRLILKGAARARMLYRSAGVPTTLTTAPTGSFCIDTTGNGLYIRTGSTLGAWVKLVTGT